MEWFISIFSEKSDQARLVTILLSTIVAIGIVLYTQKRIDRREKIRNTNEKIEELFNVTSEMIRFRQQILHKRVEPDISNDISHVEIFKIENIDLLHKKESTDDKFFMLLEIYFSDVIINDKELCYEIDELDAHAENIHANEQLRNNKFTFHMSLDKAYYSKIETNISAINSVKRQVLEKYKNK